VVVEPTSPNCALRVVDDLVSGARLQWGDGAVSWTVTDAGLVQVTNTLNLTLAFAGGNVAARLGFATSKGGYVIAGDSAPLYSLLSHQMLFTRWFSEGASQGAGSYGAAYWARCPGTDVCRPIAEVFCTREELVAVMDAWESAVAAGKVDVIARPDSLYTVKVLRLQPRRTHQTGHHVVRIEGVG